MSDDERTLLPEVLPAPQEAPIRGTARERVLEHARRLARKSLIAGPLVGVSALTTSCFFVVDPAPPPAADCREFQPLEEIVGDVTATATSLPDGRVEVEVLLEVRGGNAWGDPPVGLEVATPEVEGAEISSFQSMSDSVFLDLLYFPKEASEIIVDFTLTCDGASAVLSVRLTLDGLNVTVEQL